MREHVVTIDSEGVVTIPPEILAILGLPHGGVVAFVVHADGHIGLRNPPFTLDNVFGSIPGLPNETSDLEQEDVGFYQWKRIGSS